MLREGNKKEMICKIETIEFSSFACQFNEKGYFGGYPTATQIKLLKTMGVKLFVDLTKEGEIPIPYKVYSDCLYINYPIQDRQIPDNLKLFTKLVYRVLTFMKNSDSKVYIHCKGGHGRSGVLVACLLYLLHTNISTEQAIEMTTKYHDNRTDMREKWRKIGSPQTRQQKNFVHRYFIPLVFFRSYQSPSYGFTPFSYHEITIPDNEYNIPTGKFPFEEAAWQASRLPMNDVFVHKQRLVKTPRISQQLSRQEIKKDSAYWHKNRYNIRKFILKAKIEQHEAIKENLIKTGYKPLIYNSRYDNYFGTGNSGNGGNMLGNILMEIREELFGNIPYDVS